MYSTPRTKTNPLGKSYSIKKSPFRKLAKSVLNFPIKHSQLRKKLIQATAREHLVQKIILDVPTILNKSLLPRILRTIPKIHLERMEEKIQTQRTQKKEKEWLKFQKRFDSPIKQPSNKRQQASQNSNKQSRSLNHSITDRFVSHKRKNMILIANGRGNNFRILGRRQQSNNSLSHKLNKHSDNLRWKIRHRSAKKALKIKTFNDLRFRSGNSKTARISLNKSKCGEEPQVQTCLQKEFN